MQRVNYTHWTYKYMAPSVYRARIDLAANAMANLSKRISIRHFFTYALSRYAMYMAACWKHNLNISHTNANKQTLCCQHSCNRTEKGAHTANTHFYITFYLFAAHIWGIVIWCRFTQSLTQAACRHFKAFTMNIFIMRSISAPSPNISRWCKRMQALC